jgi:hypothetical protein
LPLCGLGGEKTIQSNNNISELKPLPNTKKFGIEVRYYNRDMDLDFMYLSPTKNNAKNWIHSLPLNEDYKSKSEGYYTPSMFLTNHYWEDKSIDVWDDVVMYEQKKMRVNNEILLVNRRFTLHFGFLDNAPFVYNQNVDDRNQFWNRIRSIYTLYSV